MLVIRGCFCYCNFEKFCEGVLATARTTRFYLTRAWLQIQPKRTLRLDRTLL